MTTGRAFWIAQTNRCPVRHDVGLGAARRSWPIAAAPPHFPSPLLGPKSKGWGRKAEDVGEKNDISIYKRGSAAQTSSLTDGPWTFVRVPFRSRGICLTNS